jgi:hypothetical protein
MKKVITSIAILTTAIFTSCEPEETPVQKRTTSGLQVGTVDLTTEYSDQVYYDLETNSEVKRSPKTIWNLGFECSPEGYHIILNSSKAMQAWATGEINFENVTSYTGVDWTWDKPGGSMDSTAIGEWGVKSGESVISNNEVYVIDLGYDVHGNHDGYWKIQILGLTSSGYEIKAASIGGQNEFTKVIPKDGNYSFVHLYFHGTHEVKKVEPKSSEWDLVFTQYTHIFYDEPEPMHYLVTGVLLNPKNVEVTLNTIIDFEDLDLEIAQGFEYTSDADGIGYDWKTYDFDAGGFVLHPEKTYVVKNRSGLYFKIRFVDFYNELGAKGNPKFEFQQL